jgi:peptidyl-prolyl cis-trans isomerase D
VLDVALRSDPAALPVLQGVDLGAQGYAVVRVNKILARPTPAENQAKQDRAQYNQWWNGAEGLAYYNLLKERFKAQILVARTASGTANLPVATGQ